MSKEKVDRYKQEKANRKEILEKEKKQKRMVKAGLGILAVLLIAWLGYSSYEKIYETFIMKDAEINLEAYNEYLTALSDDGEEDLDFDLEDTATEEELEDEASADETEAEVDQEPQADEAATDDASADGEQSPDEDASDDSAEE